MFIFIPLGKHVQKYANLINNFSGMIISLILSYCFEYQNKNK